MSKTYWILDAYPCARGMQVWLIDEDGRCGSYLDPWVPHLFLTTEPGQLGMLERILGSFQAPYTLAPVQKRNFFSNEWHDVLQVKVENPLRFNKTVAALLPQRGFTLSNADINLAQYYFYERGLFPLGRCEADIQDGVVRAWRLTDNPHDLDYPLPPLRYLHLGLDTFNGVDRAPSAADPRHRGRGQFILTLGPELGRGVTYALDSNEEDLILSLNRHVADWDPDIIITDWGDSFVLPRLEFHSVRTGVPLKLSRDPERGVKAARDRNFFSYGKMIYRAGDRTLFGRVHVDARNSFTVEHTALEGLFEMARMTKIPLQRSARCTIGTSLSSLQHEWAVKHDYLIPIDKGQVEEFRGAGDFIAADRGGLVYEPEVGWHEDVHEFDFVSMYPEIMIRHNITPEAINCACCPDNKVPEIGHHICRKKRGMIPDVLSPIVTKRAQYKELIRQNHPKKLIFAKRREAFKWALVTCFGYLGFRNARFGRIEAHECVNAYSREVLLKAKEIAEAEGYHFIHAIVDSMWLKKPGATAEDLQRLRLKIEEATNLPLGYEGRYRWLRFFPSRTNARVGVPNRYAGAFSTGEIKVRGLEVRRHDTPPFIKSLQNELLEVMARAPDLNSLFLMRAELERVADAYRERLRTGQVSPVELAIALNLTRRPEDYMNDTLSAIAAKKIAASGVKLSEGEMIHYLVAEEHDKVKDWRVIPLAFIEDAFEYDQKYYGRLVDRALDITPFFPLVSHPKNQRKTKVDRQLCLPGVA